MDLHAERLVVRVDGHLALDDVTVAIPKGSHLGVCGAPGSGKTMLLKTLSGLRRPDAGTVRWDDDVVAALPDGRRRERQAAFGMVFQSDALFDSSTVLENVLLPLVKRKVPKPDALVRAREVLQEVGLKDAEALLPDQLSGGMRKRVGIARALAARPQILLADDPLAGLDPSTGAQVADLLRAVAKGKTLIVALPDPLPWLSLPRWVRLDRGRVAYEGEFDERALEHR